MRPLFLFILLSIAVHASQAQSLYLYDVNASGFPTIRANYIVVNATGQPYADVTAADFRVTEQAGSGLPVDLSPTLTHGCRVVGRDSAASILLIVDESMSMENPVGATTRMNLVKQALITFVSGVDFTTGTAICIIGFSGNSRIACPWSTTRSVIIDSITRLAPRGVTNYETPFIGIPNIFEEFAKRPASIPKTAIFLTDDQPNPAIPNPPNLIDTVVRKANEQSIVIHSISVDETYTNPTLATIVSRTGGTSYFGTELEMSSFFELIVYSFRSRTICQIEWTAPYGCSAYDRDRIGIVTFTRPNTAADTVAYTTPVSSVAVVSSSAQILELGNPPVTGSTYASVILTPINLDMIVRGHTISPSTHFTVVDWDFPKGAINPPSPSNLLTFKKNTPRTLRIRLTEGATPMLHTAQLSLIGDPCTIVQTLRGGGSQVVVVTPNGGEVLTTCDTADIRWSGVPADAAVRIEWSLDGTTWKTIANAATGLSYRWLPTTKGLTYRIRITYGSPGDFAWMHQIGNVGIDTASSIAARPGGDKVYVTGWYSGTTQFKGAPISDPLGGKDGFMQEFDADGLWGRTFLFTGEDAKDEKIIGAVTDDIGNVYITGTFESLTPVLATGTANTTLRMPLGQAGSVRDVSNMFVAKISPVGVVEWVRYGQGTSRSASEATATTIGISKNARGQAQIVVAGTFISFINVGTTKDGVQMQFGPGWPTSTYYVTYDDFGNVMELVMRATPPTTYRYASKTTKDSTGCIYETDHFTGTILKGGFAASSRSASTDIYVARKCIGANSVDESNADFKVNTPFLSMTDPTLTMEPTTVATTTTNTFTQRLCNTTDEAVQILEATITGTNASEFVLSTPLAGRYIQPKECIDVVFEFTPVSHGDRTATLTLSGYCGTLVAPALLGEGIAGCNLFVVKQVQLSDVIIDSIVTTSSCIIRNTTAASITVSVAIQPAGTRFEVEPKGPITLAPNQCFSPIITFDATTAALGDYTAKLVYTLPAECGNLSTQLLASVRDTNFVPVKDTSISINDVDWFERRLRTVHDSLMYLRNTGKQDLFIESIALGAVDGDVTADLSSLPAMPLLLRSTESLAIPIRFVPATRGPHTTEVIATVRGISAPVKGLARGIGVLPAILASGDSWPATPILTVATKVGNVTIRNTDPTTPLRIENVEFVRPTQGDFRWAVPSATLFPAVIQPNQSLSLPVEFVPQAGGVRSEFVRVYHDAKAGPAPLPPYADTIVELIGLAQSKDALDPLVFAPTLTCDETTTSFWVPNNGTTGPLVIDGIDEIDASNVFELITPAPIVIPASDSAEIFVRFSPAAAQAYAATYNLRNASIPGLYKNVSGIGTMTNITASFPQLPDAAASALVNIPMTIHPRAPFYSGLTRVYAELLYPEITMDYTTSLISTASVTIADIDRSVAGRIAYTLDVLGPFEQDVILTTVFRTLLSADSVVNVVANLSTDYRCVNTTPAADAFVVSLTCAGSSRVVSLGASSFSLAQPYPSPATDDLTIRYSTGYTSPVTFDVIDAIGNLVRDITVGEQLSAEYELTLPVSALSAGTYVLRMTSGHYVESRIFSVVR